MSQRRFRPFHGFEIGQIIREGNHYRKVVKIVGPWYWVETYKVNSYMGRPFHLAQDYIRRFQCTRA